MKHDLSKLHPIHQKLYEEFQVSEHTPDVPDDLYNFWVELNQNIPDVIGKQERNLTASQKKRMNRYRGRVISMERADNHNAVRDFSKKQQNGAGNESTSNINPQT